MSEVKTNKISSLASNNDITIDPDGTGNTIIASGEVGVGTTTPATFTDFVSGSNAPSVVVAGSQPSYVLADTDISGNDGTLGITKAGEDTVINNLGAGNVRISNNGAERMRILSNGRVCINKTTDSFSTAGQMFSSGGSNITRSGGTVLDVNRLADDGNLINFYQADNNEGSISVSGSTVSYNGGHLSRWSQLSDNTKDTSIIKGTVMTNLDKMAVWHHEAQAATYYLEDDELPDGVSVGDEKTPAIAAYDEQNEQLNCMAVSSLEGDANVAGVFVNWDDDDTDFTADMNVAMTGDMVIRIAKDTTVARGDLLMSAGDGTAKRQDDDIVRSKTIAKVTSTTVSHTYDDGSYLVPCVLMAC